MKVTSPAEYSFVTPLGRPVAAGETVDVDDTLGAQLLEQGWKPAGGQTRKSQKPPAGEPGSETVAPPTAPTEE